MAASLSLGNTVLEAAKACLCHCRCISAWAFADIFFPSPWYDFVSLQPIQYASKTLKSRPYINFTVDPWISEIRYHQLLFKNASLCLFSHQCQTHCKLYSNWTNHQGTYFFDLVVLQIIREALETKQFFTAREMCL